MSNPEYRKAQILYQKMWRRKNPHRMAQAKKKCILKQQYGLSVQEYLLLIQKQNGGCAICGGKNIRKNNKTGLCVDHNHITGNTRGLLCDQCNRGLGLLKDSVDILSKAVKYLKKYGTKTVPKGVSRKSIMDSAK